MVQACGPRTASIASAAFPAGVRQATKVDDSWSGMNRGLRQAVQDSFQGHLRPELAHGLCRAEQRPVAAGDINRLLKTAILLAVAGVQLIDPPYHSVKDTGANRLSRRCPRRRVDAIDHDHRQESRVLV